MDGSNKIQLNLSIRRHGLTGSIIEKSLLANIRTNTVEEAVSLYASLRSKFADLRDNDEPMPQIEEPIKFDERETELVGTKDCDRCGSEMILRMAKKGLFAGSSFYGCSNYPKCRATERV